ncbi:hypothetical protein E2C01_096686 [Portunus trituberculatus]|uniref:Uncharacterized protein n=1 Tax=Portunus trituberculatus TaxID=210409 RepID=A0A5B7K7H2_PORTR|nr:hypothetical protein [Portunus trituberculatus]
MQCVTDLINSFVLLWAVLQQGLAVLVCCSRLNSAVHCDLPFLLTLYHNPMTKKEAVTRLLKILFPQKLSLHAPQPPTSSPKSLSFQGKSLTENKMNAMHVMLLQDSI